MINREIAYQYRKRTEERVNQEATRRDVNMQDLERQKVSKILRAIAEEVCGK